MHARNRTWLLGSDPVERCRQRTLPVEGGDGSTLSLDFTTGVLDPRLTFTRSTNATFINSQGLVQWADANMVTGSELCDPTLYGWNSQNSPGYLFDTSVNDPFGNPGVPRITSNATSGSSAVNSSAFAVSAGVTYTLTFWVRAGTSTTFLVGIYDITSGAFSPASGTILSGPGSISGTGAIALTSLTSAWTKVRIYITPANTAASRAISFYPQAAASGGQSNYLWGVQLNIGQTPNPAYFKTVATAYQAPRFDYDPSTTPPQPRGLLIEASASNLSRSSADLTNATYWTLQTAYTATSNSAGPSPDGTNNASSFTEPSTSLQRSIYQSYSSAAGTYTGSMWAKLSSGSTRYIRLVVSSASGNFGYVTVNITTGAVQQPAAVVGTATNASATVTAYPAGWYRITLTVTLAASVDFMFAVPMDLTSIDTPTTNYGRVAYLGNGSVFLLWGAQLETGSGASSYIPTVASTGSRAVDYCTMPTSLFITGNPYPNTLFVDCIPATANTGFPNLARLFDRTAGGAFSYGSEIYYYSAASLISQRKITASTNTDRNFANGLAYNTRHKFAMSVDSTAFIGSYDGVTGLGATTAPAALPSVSTHLGIGCNGDSSPANVMNGWMRQLKFWPTALPQATLNSITTL
jgi:hypothetical protein